MTKNQPDDLEELRRSEALDHLRAILGPQAAEDLEDLIALEVRYGKEQADLTRLASKVIVVVVLLAIALPVLAGVIRLCMLILGV